MRTLPVIRSAWSPPSRRPRSARPSTRPSRPASTPTSRPPPSPWAAADARPTCPTPPAPPCTTSCTRNTRGCTTTSVGAPMTSCTGCAQSEIRALFHNGRGSMIHDIDSLREEVRALHADLVRYDLVAWTSGNVSARVPGEDLMVIKPSGVSYDDLTASSMVLCDFDGKPEGGNQLSPSSDTAT